MIFPLIKFLDEKREEDDGGDPIFRHAGQADGGERSKTGPSARLPLVLEISPRGSFSFLRRSLHSYPHCWDAAHLLREGIPGSSILTAVKEKLVQNNGTVHWYPESIREGDSGIGSRMSGLGISRDTYGARP